MGRFKFLLHSMRIPFLILTPACLLPGVATALRQSGGVSPLHLLLVIAGGLAAHISVNTFNEYHDFVSGLDARTERTPFSGGSGALQRCPEMAGRVLMAAWVAFAVTCAIGLYFVYLRGPALLPLGLLGLIIVYTYTTRITRSAFICLLAPGLGFGPVMVAGTHFVLTGAYSVTALVASLVPFFLVSGLLLLNQFPDIDADRSAGRKHLPIVAGRRVAGQVFRLFLMAPYVVILCGVWTGYLPKACLAGLLTLFLAIPVFLNVSKYAEEMPSLIRYMGYNVIVSVATPMLVAAGLLF